MTLSIAHLGPAGTNTELAALQYGAWHTMQTGEAVQLCPCTSIAQSLQTTAARQADFAIVPVENSIEGSVTMTLDTLWQLDRLQIQHALVLQLSHVLISQASTIDTLQLIYSHPQALAQCQSWLERHLPTATLVPTNSTTEALQHLTGDETVGAIASERAASLYKLPILARSISDHPDNCTRFWILGLQPSPGGAHTSLGFVVHDIPGALIKPLKVFADRNLNLSRIESRPTKRSLGDYLFFVDLEADSRDPILKTALTEIAQYTETLKVFGSYDLLPTHLLTLFNN